MRIATSGMKSRPISKFIFVWLLVSFAIIAQLSRNCGAQVVDPITAAQAPIPGADHHYIGLGSETVNPVDGSISFELPIQTPAGRQLSFPFGIRYNESEPFYIANNGQSQQFYWTTPTLNGTPPPFSLNGWSYDLPIYVAQAFVQSASPVTSGCGDPDGNPCLGNNNTNYCWSTQNYNFRALDGLSRTLYVANWWNGPNNPQPQVNVCPQTGGYSGGGDYGVTTSLGATGSSTQPPLTVTDRSGTVYQFPQGTPITTNSTVVGGGITPFGALAQTITDKNGNQIVLNGTGAVTGGGLPAGSYTDTADRPVLSWNGIGSGSGDQLSVSGLGNIVVKWTTTTVTFPENSHLVYQTPNSGSNCGYSGPQSISMSVVSEIDLPNGQKYSFSYGDAWGRLDKITFPDGGYVRYVWGSNVSSLGTYQSWLYQGQPGSTVYCLAIVDAPAVTDRYVSYDGSSEVLHQKFTYTTNWVENNPNQLYWSSKNTIVNSDDLITGQSTVTNYTYNYVGYISGPNVASWHAGQQIPVEQAVLYQDGNSNTFRTVNKTWFDRFTMIGSQTVLDNGQGITTLRCPDSKDRILATYEYSFQSTGAKPTDPNCPAFSSGSTQIPLSTGLNTSAIGPLLRQTITAYHSFSGTNILDEPDSVSVYDGSGNLAKQTSYLYDGAAIVTSGTQKGLVSPPGLRGNATSVSHWLNTSGSSLTTTYTYFDTGQIQSMTDPCGNAACPDIAETNHKTTYSYMDHYASGTGAPSGQTNAYLTQVSYPNTGIAHQESYTWGYSDGLLRSHTDQNSQTSNYQYNDPLLRLKAVIGPPDPNNANQSPTTTYNYYDWTPTNPTPSSIAKSELENTSGTSIKSNTIMDGMGHVTHTQITSDPAGTDTVQTVYDGLGQVYTVTNPQRSSSPASTDGTTTYGYDALGRKTSQIDSDGISTQKWHYAGNTVLFTDEDGNQWQRTSDALGRLMTVLEPNGATKTPTMETDYFYDTLDNVRSVNQCGSTCPSTIAVARSFTYDSLSRLVQALNPETGWTCYGTTGGATPNGSNCISGYDANGNLTYKTDARKVVASYSYDALNRVLSKSYSNDASSTPSSCYQYDTSSVANSAGRLTNQWTQSASAGVCATPTAAGVWTRRSILAYDPMGRILNEQQCTPSNCKSGTSYTPAYTYDLAGNPITFTNGITTTPTVNTLYFTNSFDAAGHLQTLTSNWNDSAHPPQLFSAQTPLSTPCSQGSSFAYAPFGGLMNATFGKELTLNRTFDSRLRTTCEIDTGSIVASPTSGSATVTITGSEQQQ